MTEGPRNYDDELRTLFEELAESVAQSSDEEILAEAKEEGENPKQASQQVRDFLRSKVKAYQQRALLAAQQEYKLRVQNIYQYSFKLPSSPEEKRNLLGLVFSRIPEMEGAILTAQHREFKNLTNEDIEGYLKQLQELRVLEKLGLAENGGENDC